MHYLHSRPRQMDLCQSPQGLGAFDQEHVQALGDVVWVCFGMRLVLLCRRFVSKALGCLVSRNHKLIKMALALSQCCPRFQRVGRTRRCAVRCLPLYPCHCESGLRVPRTCFFWYSYSMSASSFPSPACGSTFTAKVGGPGRPNSKSPLPLTSGWRSSEPSLWSEE
jgi:hypothetical protein